MGGGAVVGPRLPRRRKGSALQVCHNHNLRSFVIIRLPVPGAALILLLAAGQFSPGQPARTSRNPHHYPNLEGIWNPVTMTPLERPAEFAGRATVTDEEARAWEKKDHSHDGETGDVPPAIAAFFKAQNAVGGADTDFWERGAELARVKGVKRTSMIVDPPDGKLPPRTPEGAKQLAEYYNRFIQTQYDSAQDLPLSERCLPEGEVPVIPFGNLDGLQIVQTAGAVMIMYEVVHDVRVVRIGAQHLPPAVRLWLGDSIGHWEDGTLVIDTTNFRPQPSANGFSEKLHVIERLSRVDANTLLYKATVDDPAIYTKPWTIELPFAVYSKRLYEYACHEGNYSIAGILAGARKSEAAQAGKPRN